MRRLTTRARYYLILTLCSLAAALTIHSRPDPQPCYPGQVVCFAECADRVGVAYTVEDGVTEGLEKFESCIASEYGPE